MITSPCVGLPPSPNVCTRSTRTNCSTLLYTSVLLYGFYVHIGSIPWATSNRQTSELALLRGAFRTARNHFTHLPHLRLPFYRPAQSPVFGFRVESATEKVSISGATDFRDTSHRLHGRRFVLAQGRQRSNLCALGATTPGVWSFVQKLERKRCDAGRVLLFDILFYKCVI